MVSGSPNVADATYVNTPENSAAKPSAAFLKSFDRNMGMIILCKHWSAVASLGSRALLLCRASATSLLHRRLGSGLSLKCQHPSGVLHRQCADLVQLLDFRIVKSDPCRIDIVPQLIHGFCADDHSCYERLG